MKTKKLNPVTMWAVYSLRSTMASGKDYNEYYLVERTISETREESIQRYVGEHLNFVDASRHWRSLEGQGVRCIEIIINPL